LGQYESLLLSAIEERREEWVALPKELGFPPSGFGLPLTAAKNAFDGKLESGMSAGAKRREFSRAKNGLIGKEIIGIQGDWIWIIGQPGAEFSVEQK
jgi:hypothetical protein